MPRATWLLPMPLIAHARPASPCSCHGTQQPHCPHPDHTRGSLWAPVPGVRLLTPRHCHCLAGGSARGGPSLVCTARPTAQPGSTTFHTWRVLHILAAQAHSQPPTRVWLGTRHPGMCSAPAGAWRLAVRHTQAQVGGRGPEPPGLTALSLRRVWGEHVLSTCSELHTGSGGESRPARRF